MMLPIELEEITIDCQNPRNKNNINRKYRIVKCIFDNRGQNKDNLYNQALALSSNVNPRKANNSTIIRSENDLISDAMGGILAEEGWIKFINTNYGEIASHLEFKTAINQIDIKLKNGETIEVRSSFVDNGVKFAICNDKKNFNNVGTYCNAYKPNEIKKDFFAAVLFQTKKEQIKESDKIEFYLIGGSSKSMIINSNIAYNGTLERENIKSNCKTNYKLVKFKDALDIDGFKQYMKDIGYNILT